MSHFSRRRFLQVAGCLLLVGPLPASSEVASSELESFLALSAELCGYAVEELDPNLGRLYFVSLEASEPGSLQRLLSSVGRPAGVQKLEASGLLKEPGMLDLTYRLTELWYSGVRPTHTGSEAVAYKDALGWKSIDFSKPPTYCGAPWGRL
ncbi:MAG: sugar dehydrogenase complex small subunit [Vulcanimicrobiota bacterium]